MKFFSSLIALAFAWSAFANPPTGDATEVTPTTGSGDATEEHHTTATPGEKVANKKEHTAKPTHGKKGATGTTGKTGKTKTE